MIWQVEVIYEICPFEKKEIVSQFELRKMKEHRPTNNNLR